MKYVNDCFTNHTLFHKVSALDCLFIVYAFLHVTGINLLMFLQALKVGFEVVCNKNVSGSPSAELLASFCNNILTKGVSNLTDEAYEETVDKVVSFFMLVTYLVMKSVFNININIFN